MSHSKLKPTIVCLCGSTRFKDTFTEVNKIETLSGKIVLAPGVFGRSGDLTPDKYHDEHPIKLLLDSLHIHKIDMCDEILVINVDGYIGESTTNEIRYAIAKNKRVRWFEDHNIPESFI